MNINWFWLAIIFVFGACIGSFLNVVIYRLPRGLTLTKPRFSFCPSCKRSLEWWENIPILGWIYLGGRCTTCRNKISPIYPAIEILTAIVFALVYWGLYMNPLRAGDFGQAGLAMTWPVLVVYLVLVGGMIGATVIDAKYYIIPLQIPWLISLAALVILPVGVRLMGRRFAHYDLAVSPHAEGYWFGAAIGGSVGLAIALALLYTGVLPQSFTDDEAAHDGAAKHPHVHPSGDDKAAINETTPQSTPGADATVPQTPAEADPVEASATMTTEAPVPAPPPVMGVASSTVPSPPEPVSIAAPSAGDAQPIPTLPPPEGAVAEPPTPASSPVGPGHDPIVPRKAEEIDAWLAHPRLNQEIGKECLFVVLPLLGFIGGALIDRAMINPMRPPLIAPWAQVLVGVLCGYLVGGGVVWIVRILGSLGFQKEAMGLGDVHLLAAIGAAMGSIDAVVVFFLAAFLGLGYAAVIFCLNRVLKERQLRIIPYGPYLAMAALVMMVLEPLVMWAVQMAVGMNPLPAGLPHWVVGYLLGV